MNGPTPVKPLRFIVEASIPQLHELVAPLLRWFAPRDPPLDRRPELAPGSTRGQAVHATPQPDDEEEEPAPPAARSPDPPGTFTKNGGSQKNGKSLAATGSHDRPVPTPRAVADIPPGYKLGALCHRSHRWQGTRKSLRSLKTGKCRECVRASDHRRTAPKRPAAPAPVLQSTAGERRPELPAHLALTTFLSPIVCTEASHRYRDLPAWTLRDLADERCTMCVMHQSQLALAGD